MAPDKDISPDLAPFAPPSALTRGSRPILRVVAIVILRSLTKFARPDLLAGPTFPGLLAYEVALD
jgi:hypothetical protein